MKIVFISIHDVTKTPYILTSQRRHTYCVNISIFVRSDILAYPCPSSACKIINIVRLYKYNQVDTPIKSEHGNWFPWINQQSCTARVLIWRIMGALSIGGSSINNTGSLRLWIIVGNVFRESHPSYTLKTFQQISKTRRRTVALLNGYKSRPYRTPTIHDFPVVVQSR